jgi:hypothetical protein
VLQGVLCSGGCWAPPSKHTAAHLNTSEFLKCETAAAAAAAVRCREFGPVFSWMLGPTQMTTVLDYDAIKSLLQLGDSKVRGESTAVSMVLRIT